MALDQPTTWLFHQTDLMYSPGMAPEPPAFVRLAAHPLRWSLLTALAGSDLRVRELVDHAGQPQNLVSYHLRLLRDSGLVTARRSSHDGRDSYYHLDLDRCAAALAETGAALHPALLPALHPALHPELHSALQPELHPALQPELHPALQPELHSPLHPELLPVLHPAPRRETPPPSPRVAVLFVCT